MRKATIMIGNEQKGFFFALGRQMCKDWRVQFIVDNQVVANLLANALPDLSFEVFVAPDKRIRPKASREIFRDALKLEEEYQLKMAFLMGHDRAFGFGYLTNVERYPMVKRAFWPQKEKLQQVVDEFREYRDLLKDSDLLVSQFPNTMLTAICKKLYIPHYHLSAIKFGDRHFWSDDNFQGSESYFLEIQNSLEKIKKDESTANVAYVADGGGAMVNAAVDYRLHGACKKALKIFFYDTFNYVLGRRKRNGYRVYGWIPSIFRKRQNYYFVKSRGHGVSGVSDRNIVYFPLHMEPEVALLQFSPENGNTIESIIWVSKSLPADYVLVVKEQANAFLVRSRRFYERLLAMPNVVLADPDIHSWDWIQEAKIVATITGSVGQEAVHFEKPVISFGAHHVINNLPTVQFVQSFNEVKGAIERLVREPYSKSELKCAREALTSAQINCSFELPEYKFNYKTTHLAHDEAKVALDALSRELSRGL
jgi:hypothetical protein